MINSERSFLSWCFGENSSRVFKHFRKTTHNYCKHKANHREEKFIDIVKMIRTKLRRLEAIRLMKFPISPVH